MNTIIEFPSTSEYPSYAEMYMKLVKKDGSLLKQLMKNLNTAKEFIATIPEEKLHYKYAADKWSIKEVLNHIIDDERIYGYRALSFARNDKTNFPGFEQEDYTEYSNANDRTIKDIMEEYETVRKATISLFKSFSEEALLRIGTANGNNTSVRALGYHIAGHELHHLKIINEKYLK